MNEQIYFEKFEQLFAGICVRSVQVNDLEDGEAFGLGMLGFGCSENEDISSKQTHTKKTVMNSGSSLHEIAVVVSLVAVVFVVVVVVVILSGQELSTQFGKEGEHLLEQERAAALLGVEGEHRLHERRYVGRRPGDLAQVEQLVEQAARLCRLHAQRPTNKHI